MPAAATLPRRSRTRREWIDLAAMLDRDILPSAELLADLGDDAKRILEQASRVIKWGNAVVGFYNATVRYSQRHTPPEGVPKGPDGTPEGRSEGGG